MLPTGSVDQEFADIVREREREREKRERKEESGSQQMGENHTRRGTRSSNEKMWDNK